MRCYSAPYDSRRTEEQSGSLAGGSSSTTATKRGQAGQKKQ